VDLRHPGIIRLAAYQQRFFDEFMELRPQRAVLAWAVGTGKTLVAATIADLLSREGLVLVVTPAFTVPQWADQIRALQREDPIQHERMVTILDREMSTYLRALRNVAVHSGSFSMSHNILVVSTERASRPDWATLLAEIPWRLVIIDEAHRLTQSERGKNLVDALTERALAILAITATADGVRLGEARRFDLDDGSPPAARHHRIEAEPTPAERAFVEAVSEWAKTRPSFLTQFAFRLAVLNPLAAVSLLERVAGPRREATPFVLDEIGAEVEVPATTADDGPVHSLLQLGDLLVPPGSKTSRVIDLIENSTPYDQPVLVIATLVQDVTEIGTGVSALGRAAESVSAAMEPDERLAAAQRMREKQGVLVVSHAALSAPLAASFDFVVHRDAGFGPDALDRRLALLPDIDSGRRQIASLVVVWPPEFEHDPIRTSRA
jgi:hypothetical protein